MKPNRLSLRSLILEANKYEQERADFVEFVSDKKFTNARSKKYIWHGTSVHPSAFKLLDDYDGDSGNVYHTDLPEGYLFLTDDMREANVYGSYLIPCELKRWDSIKIKVKSNAPSVEFDEDFMGYGGEYRIWERFFNSGKSVLEVRGYDKTTFVTSVENVIPRTDLATEFYKKYKRSE